MSQKTMTVGELITMLQKIENPKRAICWTNAHGNVGHFFATEQGDLDSEAIDNGPAHLMLGGCPE